MFSRLTLWRLASRTFCQVKGLLERTESAARTMLGKFYVAFVRKFIDILAEHHANSKMEILRVSTGEDYRDLQAKLVNAAHRMKRDGWWLTAAEHPVREKTIFPRWPQRARRCSARGLKMPPSESTIFF